MSFRTGNRDRQQLTIYTGPSMNPTLKAGDGLFIVPYRGRGIAIGDVVVFRHPEGKQKIIHRVVACHSGGFRTRGDNNARPDPWLLTPEAILGKVVAANRKGRIIPIHGGIRGLMATAIRSAFKNAERRISRGLHPLYHWLAGSGFFLRLRPFLPKMRILVFHRPDGQEWQLFLKNKRIGDYRPENGRWRIGRLFRLFVDEQQLPPHPADNHKHPPSRVPPCRDIPLPRPPHTIRLPQPSHARALIRKPHRRTTNHHQAKSPGKKHRINP